MNRLILSVLLIVLVGCDHQTGGSGRDKGDYEYLDTQTGLRVAYDVPSPITPDFIKEEWLYTLQCTELYASGPYVAMVKPGSFLPYSGMFYRGDEVIEIDADCLCIDVVAHEMIHYLLFENGLAVDNHESVLFSKCAPFSTLNEEYIY